MKVQIKTPRWSLPLLTPKRYKGTRGGRGSGKSHFFAESIVEAMILNPDLQVVCIREIQKSLKFSAKKLIESKIRDFGLSALFDITLSEIRRADDQSQAKGIIIFQGMQDHTADSIKSLEGFDIAWVEEAQSLSKRSLELLRPTIRKKGSELWFSWNPENEDDAVEQLFSESDEHFICVNVNYYDNPFLPDVLRQEMEYDRKYNPDSFDHIWLGGYNTKTDAQVFKDKFEINEFEPEDDWSIYHGLDFGFSQDPTAAVRVYIHDDNLYIYNEAYKIGLELDDTATHLKRRIPNIEQYVIRADNARPESISYLGRNGLPKITAVEKGKGSVEDGIAFIKSFQKVIIHPSCEYTAREFRLYSYKRDKRTDDILPILEDANNHIIDAVRYSIEPLMKQRNNKIKQQSFRL